MKRTSLGPDEDELLPGGLTEGRGQVSQGESFTEPSSVTSSTSTDSCKLNINTVLHPQWPLYLCSLRCCSLVPFPKHLDNYCTHIHTDMFSILHLCITKYAPVSCDEIRMKCIYHWTMKFVGLCSDFKLNLIETSAINIYIHVCGFCFSLQQQRSSTRIVFMAAR